MDMYAVAPVIGGRARWGDDSWAHLERQLRDKRSRLAQAARELAELERDFPVLRNRVRAMHERIFGGDE